MIKELTTKAFLSLPTLISPLAYDLARRWLLRDPREVTWNKVFEHIRSNKIGGDYLEFGVYRGTSFISSYKCARRFGLDDMRFFAFDSFEGLPNNEGFFRTGELSSPEYTFKRMMAKTGVDTNQCITVSGFYSESLTDRLKEETNLARAAIVHVDCDLYTSTKAVLDFIEDLVDVGTVLVFDDWYVFGGHPEASGEAKAFSEWPLCQRFAEMFDGTSEGKPQAKGFLMTVT